MSTFYTWHHTQVAKIIGSLSRTIPDQTIQQITEDFGRFFENDNDKFSFRGFQKAVTRIREGSDH